MPEKQQPLTIPTSLSLDAKKRYERDFLLSMKDKLSSREKPKGLPEIPNVIVDEVVQITRGSHYGGEPRKNIPSMDGYGSRGSMKGKGSRYGKQQQQQHQQQPQLPINKNAYRILSEQELNENEKVLREVRSIMNKLTPQKFSKLVEDLTKLPINTEDRLRETINIIFEKSIDEPAFSQTYANLCKVLCNIKVPSSEQADKSISFRAILLTRCQKEFNTDFYKEINYDELFKEAEECTDETKKRELKEQLEEKLTKAKRRSLGNIRFIGELFKLRMLTDTIMHDCINRLLKPDKENLEDEENLECLCKLLTTIGKDIDGKSESTDASEKTKVEKMNQYFDRLSKIVAKSKAGQNSISSRIRFMILDVIDLRANKWIQRRPDNAPKTIDEIHREAQEEEQRSLAEIARLNAQDAHKRSQQPPGIRIGRGGIVQSTGGRSSSMDTETFQKQKQAHNMASKVSHMRTNLTSDADIMLKPPSFNKTSSMSGPSRTQTQQSSRIDNRSVHVDDDSNRRASMSGPVKAHRQYSTESSKKYQLDKIRQMERGNGSETSSQASSREASQSRPSESRDSSVSRPVVEAIKQLPIQSIIKKRTYTRPEIERKANNMIEEFIQNDDISESLKDLEEFQPINEIQLEEFIHQIIQLVLERTTQVRTQIGKLFSQALNQNIIKQNHYVAAFKSIFETVEDLAYDVPLIGQYLAELLAPMFQEEANIEYIKDIFDPILDQSISADIIAKILHLAANRLGHSSVVKIFKQSNLNINDFLQSQSDKNEYLKNKKIDWIISGRERTQSASLTIEQYEQALYEILKQPKIENEAVFEQIEVNKF